MKKATGILLSLILLITWIIGPIPVNAAKDPQTLGDLKNELAELKKKNPDKEYFYVSIEPKHAGCEISEPDFINEMLTQSVRHEVYQQTKNIRELLLARAMASSVIVDEHLVEEDQGNAFTESEILKDWFAAHEESKI